MFNLSNMQIPTSTEINPTRFYSLINLIQTIDEATLGLLEDLETTVKKKCEAMNSEVEWLSKTQMEFTAEISRTQRKKGSLFDITEPKDFESLFGGLSHTAAGNTFLSLVTNLVSSFKNIYDGILDIIQRIKPEQVILIGAKVSGIPSSLRELQTLTTQMQINHGAITRFSEAVLSIDNVDDNVINLGQTIYKKLESYYSILIKRHSAEGLKIQRDPISTDLAMSIYENVDSNGEIQDGRKPDEISAYSIRKATLIIDSTKQGVMGEILIDPQMFLEFITANLISIKNIALNLRNIAGPLAEKVRKCMGYYYSTSRPRFVGIEIDSTLTAIKEIDPLSITFNDKTGLMTFEEKHDLEFRNQTLQEIAYRLNPREKKSSSDLVKYVLGRKAELREYQLEENSFFVCKIGAGNMFSGEAPGQLALVPGIKPTVDLNDVIGSGFGEIREFIKHTIDGAKWFDLFLATSPSKKTDKSNVLLVGPQGSGKTEVLRAVSSNRQSVGIFAQASDFLTCWKGEAEKNPKRLFEQGLKIQRESKKQVFFLIDEIDTILNGDRGQFAFGGTNLATEFQVLMDGIMSYPSLALWGATNCPQRIPMPLIRRFSKVIIVGELDQKDRVTLLRKFLDFLPTQAMSDIAVEEAAQKLDGAVGDVIRKVIDHIWRQKMSQFVTRFPTEAEGLVKFLNEEGKLQIRNFSQVKREKFLEQLRHYVQVTPTDLLGSVDLHLNNIAIRHEISTAKETYAGARKLLVDMDESEDNSNSHLSGVRVGAILKEEDGVVHFFGYGVYEGDFVPYEAIGPTADTCKRNNIPLPRIRLDNGKVVYGCECWWAGEEAAKVMLSGKQIREVDIDQIRKPSVN